jgi:TonB family protein
MSRNCRLIALSFGAILAASSIAAAQDTLASARQLYGSAAYDEALTVLDRLRAATEPPATSTLTVDEYRAFCLMALGRQAEAMHAIEAVVAADPMFLPNESDVAPRVVTAFRDARRRLLPNVAQQRYLVAKAAYERKEFASALSGFEGALQVMDAPDLAEALTQPPLSDLRTLATGFRELARAALAPPPAPPKPKPEPIVEPTPPPPPPKTLFSSEDGEVTPPTVVQQKAPQWPAGAQNFMVKGRRGVLEVVIDEQGAVESAVMRQSIAKVYDDTLMATAKTWRYKPAVKNNLPVKYKKLIQITVE